MKIVTKEQTDAAANATMVGGAKGAAAGLAVFIPAFLLASRRFPALGRLPLVQKAFLGTVVTLGAGATNGELTYERYIREQWNDPTAERLHRQEQQIHDEWVSMSPKERLLGWAAQHRYQIVVGSWLATMVGAGAYIFAKNPTQTFSQKLVQGRMVAQGATVAVLIATAGLSQFQFEDENTRPQASWKQSIEQPQTRAPPLGSVHPSHQHK